MYTNSDEFLHFDNLRIEVELEMKQKKEKHLEKEPRWTIGAEQRSSDKYRVWNLEVYIMVK